MTVCGCPDDACLATRRMPGRSPLRLLDMHNRHRFYAAELGRFLGRDPIGYVGGIHVYGYVGGSPLGNVDPSGFVPIVCECRGRRDRPMLGRPRIKVDCDRLATTCCSTACRSHGGFTGNWWREGASPTPPISIIDAIMDVFLCEARCESRLHGCPGTYIASACSASATITLTNVPIPKPPGYPRPPGSTDITTLQRLAAVKLGQTKSCPLLRNALHAGANEVKWSPISAGAKSGLLGTLIVEDVIAIMCAIECWPQ